MTLHCKWIAGWGLLLCSLVLSPLRAQTLVVPDVSNAPTSGLALNILKLALSKTAPGITYRMLQGIGADEIDEALTQGKLSVIWAGTTLEREQALLPVRIPVLKGLLGYRLFIIRKQDQPRFNRVRTLAQLKRLVAGSGSDWGDSAILRANGLPVKLASGQSPLLAMLIRGEIDYFPRALHEPWAELRQEDASEVTVERNLLLIYPFPLYFFVAPGNRTLHDQIYRGLELAIEDGSFNRLFFGDPTIQAMLSQARVGERKVLRLINPYLHPETPFYREAFWLDPSQLHALGQPSIVK